MSLPDCALEDSTAKGDSLLEAEYVSVKRSESESGLDGGESGVVTEEAVFVPSEGKERLLFGGEGSKSATGHRERETSSTLETETENRAVATDSETTAIRTEREGGGLFLAKEEGESLGERQGEEGGGRREDSGGDLAESVSYA